MTNTLLADLPIDRILSAFHRSSGNEIDSGKFDSPESSAALAANMLGIFLAHPTLFPELPGSESWGWPAVHADLEFQAPFPWWPRGKHPWLDGAVVTGTNLIGIESKRYEPFRGAKRASFSKTYWRDVWGARMAPYLAIRDALRNSPTRYRHLDATQLVKHAFGLSTEAGRRGLSPALVYLYAEPEAWPDGRAISGAARDAHRTEVAAFGTAIAGAEVAFAHLSYREFVALLDRSGEPVLSHHAAAVRERYPDF